MERARLVRGLKRPEAYTVVPDRVSHLETHISDLFFAGDRVYKVKKPVDFGFLDFTRLEQRKFFCEEEVRLNRRLAPRVYLGVVPIGVAPNGKLRVGGTDEPVEYAVEMRRLPARRMLDRCLERGEIDNDLLNRLAAQLVAFHADAESGSGVTEQGALQVIAENARGNFDALDEFAADPGGLRKPEIRVVSPTLLRFLRERAETVLEEKVELFARRQREGRIRDGHGDLHAGNLCLTEAGIIAYDCIEFSPRFRCGDVASDLAFLAMDLDLRCFRGFSDYLVHRYALEANDPELAELMPFYKSYRALVRAKVAALRAQGELARSGEGDPLAIESARREAMGYANLAATYFLSPALVLTCGLPASGKSWCARAIGHALEGVVLRSDVIRKQQPFSVTAGFGPGALPDGEPLDGDRASKSKADSLYSEQAKAGTYQRLAEMARSHLDRGRTVILDATFGRRRYREPFLKLAIELGVPLLVVHTVCDRRVIEERMVRRASDAAEPSDADLRVHDELARQFEPPAEVSPECRAEIREELPPEEIVARTLELWPEVASRDSISLPR